MAAPNRQNKPDLQAEIDRYRKSLEENPGSRLFAALADAMRRSGDIRGAISIAEEGLKRHPRYLGGMVVLGQAYADNQQFDRGKELFLQVVRMNPENILAQRALADIYEKLGETFNAMRTYAILNILDPSDKKVRARLQELEESRNSTSRPGTRHPAPGSMAAAAAAIFAKAAPETPAPAAAPATEPDSPAPEPSAAPAPEPPPEASAPEPAAPAPELPPEATAPEPAAPAPAEPPAPPPLPDPPPMADPVVFAPVRPEVQKRMAGLDLFFAEESATEPEATPALHPAPQPEDAAPSDDEDTAVLSAEPPLPPPAATPLKFTVEERLDLFFGGADLDRAAIADRAEGFVVKPASDAIDGSEPSPAPPPLAATTPVTMTQSKLGAIFWNQGFREKALTVMAGEINTSPGNMLLRAEFSLAARALELDPDQFLEAISTGLSTRTEPEPAPEPTPEPEPQPEPPPPTADELQLDENTTDVRINVLRSYLNRIRKDKESGR